MKKRTQLIASTLVLTTLLTTNTFAVSYSLNNETPTAQQKTLNYDNDKIALKNNPFFYETEQDPWTYSGSTTITQKQAGNYATIYNIISGLFGLDGLAPTYASILVGNAHHIGSSGTIQVWKSEKRKYKTSQITGKKQLDSKWDLARMKFTNSDGEVLFDTTRSFKTY